MPGASKHYDTIVIGSGPGGEAAAMNLAKHGQKVAMVEKHRVVGGACTHLGTIPSKALRHSVSEAIAFNTNPMFRDIGEPRVFCYQDVLRHAKDIASKQVIVRTDFYSRNKIDLVFGFASFIDKNTIKINLTAEAKHKEIQLSADNFIIATGSSPYLPDDIDFSHPRIYNSDTILDMEHTPPRLTIYGAGVIGCEYASIFAGLGVRVGLVNTRDRLLSFLDDEIADALSYQLRNENVLVRHNEEYSKIEADDDGVTLHMQSGKIIHSTALLWCNGRSGNTANLGLENVGLKADSRGQLKVNKAFCTDVPNIFAVGDVIGWPSLASASYDQGRAASFGIMGKKSYWKSDDVPTGIYTIPEISSVGKNERELTEAKVPYEVGQAHFKNTARAQITGQRLGMLKILFHRETLQILGIHCFGDQAAEIIHIGQAIMNQKGKGNTIKYFTAHTFNYPTMAEAYRIAALDGLNRIRYKVPEDDTVTELPLAK